MNLIQKDTLNAILETVTPTTELTNQLMPWTWLGDHVVGMICNSFGHKWPDEKVTGYCLPFAKPVTVEGSNDLYWLYFVAFYNSHSNHAVESTGIEYSLYIEGETEHFHACLSGWSAGRHHGVDECHAGTITGIVDWEGQVIYDRWPDIRRRMEWFSRTLMERELRRGDAYLACYATHFHNATYTSAGRPFTLGSLELPTYRTLNQIAEGK
jgi:hypothetical protein